MRRNKTKLIVSASWPFSFQRKTQKLGGYLNQQDNARLRMLSEFWITEFWKILLYVFFTFNSTRNYFFLKSFSNYNWINTDYFDRKSVFNSIFREVLGLSQNWKQGTEISHIASSPTHTYMYTHVHTCTALLPWWPSTSPIRAVHLWQLVKLHWHIIITQNWSFTLELILGVVHSRVWTCIMTYVYHYRII